MRRDIKMNNNIKPRLQWVDTAKGICILLVILFHTTEHIMDLSPAIRDMLRATRMPLYYTIAGLFVSVKSPKIFLNKKINRLIIPFCFFILLGDFVSYIKSVIDTFRIADGESSAAGLFYTAENTNS